MDNNNNEIKSKLPKLAKTQNKENNLFQKFARPNSSIPAIGFQNFRPKSSIIPGLNSYISNSTPFEITPPEIFFHNIQINKTYETYLYVRNLTKIPRRIRVKQPKMSKFRCDYDLGAPLAAGISMKLVITFETNNLGDFHDSIKIKSDNNYKNKVLIHAFAPQSSIIFEPSINFGFIKVNKEAIQTITFKNEGQATGKIEIRHDKLKDSKIEPLFLKIAPGKKEKVKVTLK